MSCVFIMLLFFYINCESNIMSIDVLCCIFGCINTDPLYAAFLFYGGDTKCKYYRMFMQRTTRTRQKIKVCLL